MASDLSALLPEIRHEIAGLGHRVGPWGEVPAGAVLWTTAPARDALVFLLEGAVQISTEPPPSAEPAEKFVAPAVWTGALWGGDWPTLQATTDVVFLVLDRAEFLRLGDIAPHLRTLLEAFLLEHLAASDRAALEMRRERQASREAFLACQQMATLGQLAAGLAHELNNPVAALEQSLAVLRERLLGLLTETDASLADLLRRALAQATVAGEDLRERLETLAQAHPLVPRPLLRRLAQCDPATLAALPSSAWAGAEADPAPGSPLARLLDVMEMGAALRRLEISGERVARLVRSVKRHSQPVREVPEEVEVAASIGETLVVLQNVLRHIEVTTDLEKLPHVWAPPGPLGQVWTNLLVNAAEAMDGRGRIHISARPPQEGEERLEIIFDDSGPGVPESLRERVFTMGFTTKSGRAGFGLGLGLALCREMVSRQGGQIFCTAAPPPLGGARFVVRLPLRAFRLPCGNEPQAPQGQQGINNIKERQPGPD